jgi:tripartite-type tricarboxylate transporter receptor subunit TctC
LSRAALLIVQILFAVRAVTNLRAASLGDEGRYPVRPIRFVIPFPPQGGIDIVGRIVAQGLQESLGQTLTVDNRGGNSGIPGTDLVAKAAPDGYTLLATSLSLAINAALFSNLPYDTLKSLVSVSIYGREDCALIIHPGIKAKTVKELLDLARAVPGGLIYASTGRGGATHLAVELLKLAAQVPATHVPYPGSGDALRGIASGKMEFGIFPQSAVLPFVKSGKVAPLAVTGGKRSTLFPQVPTMQEGGVADYEFSAWYVLLAPGGTPASIITRLNSEMGRITGRDSIKAQFSALGVDGTHNTPEQALTYVKSEIEKWDKVVHMAGLKADFARQSRTATVPVVGANLPGAAQEYPSRELRLVVPFPPGGAKDVLAKILGKKLHEFLGKAVVIDNRGGAGGTTGTGIVAKAPADGHTLLMNNISLATSVTLFPKLPYDTLKDLMPLSIVGRQPNVLVVGPTITVNTVQELLNLARAKPGALVFGSGGPGSSSHLAAERLKLATNTVMTHVPYKGLGPAMTDLVAGKNDLIVATVSTVLPIVKAGKVQVLAVTTAKRTSFFPDTPTMIEAGIPDYEVSTWYSLLTPARTPAPVVTRLNNELAKIAASENVKTQFAVQGMETGHTTPEQALAYIRSEIDKWGRVVKASGAKIN